jgi:hypothetical protein
MPNKKINQLDVKVAVSTDLMLVGDPTTGTAYKSTLATLPLVPTSRTITINGVAFDLLQNRAWTIGTVTSVGLSMPSAFSVANSPITSSGTLAVTAIGTAAQYIRGDGQLATLPSNSSGGSSVAYYLNGSVAASVATYFQMSKITVIGTGTDFSKAGNGLISQFLTDVADPNRLEIPAGNWNFEMYMSASSSGGTPAFYVELLKYDGTTFTSIASSSAIPEAITGGTTIDLYLTSLAIPQTTLLSTDRLAIRVYIVNSVGGRTITMHTENSHLSEIITNFAGGVSALNGLTANTQYFATGTSGTNFAISSVGDTHTFNLPTASGTNRGALSSADWTTFNAKQSAITLTTTGTSGAATLVGATLNIPQYSGTNIYNASGTLTSARALTLGGFNLDLIGSTHTNRFTAAGRLLLGTTTEGTNILEVADTSSFGTNTFTNKLNAKFGTFGIQSSAINNGLLADNMFYNGSSWTRTATGHGYAFQFYLGQVIFHGVNTGTGNFTANNTIKFDYAGNFLLGQNLSATPLDFSNAKLRFTNNGRLLLGGISEDTYIFDVLGISRIIKIDNNTASIAEFVSNNKLSGIGITYEGLVAIGTSSNGDIKFTTKGNGVVRTDNPSVVNNSFTINSTTQGFLPPRMTTTQKNAIGTPAQGLMVFDTTLAKLCVYSGSAWETITSL